MEIEVTNMVTSPDSHIELAGLLSSLAADHSHGMPRPEPCRQPSLTLLYIVVVWLWAVHITYMYVPG